MPPGVRVKYYDNHTDSWTTKGDWLTIEQVGSTEIVTKATPTYKNSYQVTFNKFDGGATRKAMLFIHTGGSEVECDTILVRHVVTYPGTDFEPEAVAKREDGSDIIAAPMNIGATKVMEEKDIKLISSKETDEIYQDYFEKVGYYFQWGRKTGVKYTGQSTKITQETVSTSDENKEEYQNTYILGSDPESYSWSSDNDPYLWNAGTEENPIKGKNDPCPPGWRIVTKKEFERIKEQVVSDNRGDGFGISTSIKDTKIKLPAAGLMLAYSESQSMIQYQGKLYWFTSLSKDENRATSVTIGESKSIGDISKSFGIPVRCIQEQIPSL